MSKLTKIIGIAGGSASGKTTIAKKLLELSKNLGQINIIKLDNYYKDRSNVKINERSNINYDHPAAFDIDLLKQNIIDLRNNKSVEIPIYKFDNHTRSLKKRFVPPSKVIILEGILVLAFEEIRNLLDIKIFVDTPADIRFIRRLKRDLDERGRTLDSVVNQYLTYVKPMHEKFVEPTKKIANLIIPEGGKNEVAIDIIYNKILKLI